MWTKVHRVSFVQRGRGCSWSTDFWCAHTFRRYSRSKSKVVRNQAEIWTFFALPSFRGRTFRKLYACYQPCFAPRRLEKFDEDILTNQEVIGVHTLNCKRNFKFWRLKFFFWGGGSPVPVGMCDIKAWLISSACKNLRAQHPLRAEILYSEKCTLGWVNMHLYNF